MEQAFDETDYYGTLPKGNLCNQIFLSCSICLCFNIYTYSLFSCNPLWLEWIIMWCLMLYECWVVQKATPCFVCLHCWYETICAGYVFRGSCDDTCNATLRRCIWERTELGITKGSELCTNFAPCSLSAWSFTQSFVKEIICAHK